MSAEAVDSLRRADYFRRPFAQSGQAQPRKEWQHFVVHADDLRLIVNFSLNDRMTSAGMRLDPRTIVIATTADDTVALIERSSPDTTRMQPASIDAWLGDSRLHSTAEGYVAAFGTTTSEIAGIVRFEPKSMPFIVNNQPIAGRARLSWLFVPRLRASGHVRLRDRQYVFEDAPGYHDHNWGTFEWGDDFGWEWASFLPHDAGNPYTVVYMRITDSRAMETRGQALYVWKGSTPVGLWRNRQIEVDLRGVLRQPPERVLPPIAKLLRQGRRCDIPATVRVATTSAREQVVLDYTPTRYSQVVLPDEAKGRGTVVLNETHGPARLRLVGASGQSDEVELGGTYEYVRS